MNAVHEIMKMRLRLRSIDGLIGQRGWLVVWCRESVRLPDGIDDSHWDVHD